MDVRAVQQHLALILGIQGGKHAQKRRLSRAVRADDRRALADGKLDVQIVQDCFSCKRHRKMANRHRHQSSLLNRNKKNGAPRTAMRMPTGSSTGAKAVRANVSLKVTTAAPKSADAGSRKR